MFCFQIHAHAYLFELLVYLFCPASTSFSAICGGNYPNLYFKVVIKLNCCTMSEKFSILHEAKLSAILKISSLLYSKQVRVFENKTPTNSL